MHIEINGFSKQQVFLANMVWNSSTLEDIQKLVATYGVDVIIVRDMILAEYIDMSCDDVTEANIAISKIKGMSK